MQQDVPEGYKLTEVGVIPEDWNIEPLENFTSFISYGFTNPMPTTSSGPFMVTARDINSGRILYEKARKTSESAYFSLLSTKSRPKLNDILLTKDGTLGRLALVDREGICINQSVALLRPNERIDPLYFKKLLESPTFQKKMIEDAGGSTIKHIYITIVNKMAICVPVLKKEQMAIAKVLADTDVLINSLEKLIAKKCSIKTATMQQLLTGKKRLPPFDANHKGYKQTELGAIPEDWEVFELGSITKKVGSGKTPKGGASVYVERGIPLVRSQNVGWGHLKLNDVVYIAAETHETFLGSELRHGDVLLNITGASIGRCAVANNDVVNGNVNQHVCIIRVSLEQFNPQIIASLILSEIGQNQIDSFQAGGNREGLNFAQVKLLKFPVTTNTKEQSAIAAVLSDMDLEIDELEQCLDKTKKLKQGMMQELLTGKTRFVEVESPV